MGQDLELIEETREVALEDASMATQIARAELDTLIATARTYPRSIKQAMNRMLDLVTLDEEAADDAIYALPRGGKTLEGPSIRFAEAAAQSWSNCRVAARTVHVDKVQGFVEAEGFFLDAETNVATLARVRRRITDSKGRTYNEDMIVVTSNAAQSIARRNAILAGIPKAVWRRPYEAARQVLMGDFKTLANRRAEALAAFTRYGISDAQVFALLGVKGAEDIDQEKMVPLRGMYASIKNGDVTVDELLRSIAPVQPARVTASQANMAAPSVLNGAGVPSVDAAPATVAQPSGTGKPDKEPDKEPTPTSTASAPAAAVAADKQADTVAVTPAPADAMAKDTIRQANLLAGLQAKLDGAKTAKAIAAAWRAFGEDYESLDEANMAAAIGKRKAAEERVSGGPKLEM